MSAFETQIAAVTLVAAAMVLANGCGPASGPADGSAPDDATVSHDGGLSGPARSIFDLDGIDADFFAFPFPSDLRLRSDGTPDLAGFPAETVALVADLLSSAGERPGWPTIPVAYFRFTAPLSARSSDVVLDARPSSPFLLVDVDPTSADRGSLVPTIARTLTRDRYTGDSLVAVAGLPGWVLHPQRRYAFVVRTTAGSADGTPAEPDAALTRLLSGEAPTASWGNAALAVYAPLRETLPSLGLAPGDVAAATVFTTGDVVADLRRVVEGVRAREAVVIEGLAIDARDGADHRRFCELVGTVSMPQFQVGTPPFDTGGRFVRGPDGLPVVQRRETVKLVLTNPKRPMPDAGYPWMLYIHGSGGVAAQVVDRGPAGRDGRAARGEGPAHVVAAHGLGAVGTAMPLSPDRLPGASELAYLNFSNLAAFPYTFRQGVIEQALLLDALDELRIDPAVLAGCSGPSLPAGRRAYRFDAASTVGLGQSMGAMYLNMLTPIEPRLTAIAPTGAGGFWSAMILETEVVTNTRALLGAVLRADGEAMSHLHPALHLLELAWEPAEPMVYMPRIARRPLAGLPPRPVYQPVGRGDTYFPTSIFDAVTIAYGHRQAGDRVWNSMQTHLAYAGLDGLEVYPVTRNLENERGERYTGVVVQSAGDGFSDPHTIFMQVPGIRHQWSCFLATALTGTATVVAPADPGSPCGP